MDIVLAPSYSPTSVASDCIDDRPLQIGIVIIGEWKETKKALQYLILLLNTKQSVFEYQLIAFDDHYRNICCALENDTTRDVLDCLYNTKTITTTKNDLNHSIDELADSLRLNLCRDNAFDASQIPKSFIFISPSKHVNDRYFQLDGTNGVAERITKGAVILTGHHCKKLAPPTVIEFIFKFIFRITIKWKFPLFTRKVRHYGQKGCLFDFTNTPDLIRYMILHNFICINCSKYIGYDLKDSILNALDPVHLYGDEIERHPAKISSKLGFNLSLTKGIYKSRADLFYETLTSSFSNRLGSISAVAIFVSVAFVMGLDISFGLED